MRPLAWIAVVAACGTPDPTMPEAGPDTGDAAAPAHVVAYVSGYGTEIVWLDFDPATGAFTPVGAIAAPQSSFLAMTGEHLYAVNEASDRVSAYEIASATGALTFINDTASTGAGPAHLSVDRAGKFVLVANYGGGSVAVLPIRGDGGLGAAIQTVAAGANAHQIVTDPANRHALVPCKGADRVAQYAFDPATGALTANGALTTAAGAGPRHLAFAPDGRHAYLVNENASTLSALGYDAASGELTELHTLSTRAATGGNNTGAEVWVHPSGKWVYASNRGDNTIARFAIDAATGRVTLAGQTPSGGATPRSFAIDPTGAWLVVANQDADRVVSFAIDRESGELSARGTPIMARRPAFVGFVALARR